MSKIRQIAIREYLYNIRKPSFLFAAFGTPLIIIFTWILVFACMGSQSEPEPITQVGMVDLVGIIDPTMTIDGVDMTIIPYTDETTARADLDAEQLGAYFVLPEGFKTSGILPIYSYQEVPSSLQWEIRRLIVSNISSQSQIDM
ncbi:MAG TPA: hypothetical protein PLZ51_02355, partial [Aggregatilineales bacterium]|nr:hypothetical protein [Aggregatilineales bacterium]